MLEDKRKKRVWAGYLLHGEPDDVTDTVARSLDAGNNEDACAYFGLSDGGNMDCVGSHHSDGELTIWLEPVEHLSGTTRVTYLLVVLGHADGLRDPSITPPLIGGGEARDWGSWYGGVLDGLALGRAAMAKELKSGYPHILCAEE